MKKIKKYVVSLTLIFTILISVNINPVQAEIYTPSSTIIPCNSGKNMIKVVSKNKTSVYKRLPIFVSGKSTFTVQDEYSTTISNSATINLFPEILDM